MNFFFPHSPLALLLVLILLQQLPSPSLGSLFCPHTAYPSSEAEFVELRVEVQAQDDPIQLGQPIYRLKRAIGGEGFGKAAESDGGTAFRRIPGERPFRLFTSAHSSECPKRGCLHELALAEPRVPGTLFYHADTIMGKLIPPGFLTVEANPRLYCAIVKEDCGAQVPIYRHFKMVGPRVYYAYSTSLDVEIGANFTRESMPMCFGWSAQRPSANGEKLAAIAQRTEIKAEDVAIRRLLATSGGASAEGEEEKAAREGPEEEGGECQTSTGWQQPSGTENGTFGEQLEAMEEGILVQGFALLTTYDNGKLGTLRDHLYTTRKQPAEGGDYKREKDLGLVLVDPSQTGANCSANCLVKLGQMLANRSDGLGIFPLRDHKLVLMGKESADTYYTPTGEQFYCAKQPGQCGAQLALRRYWHLVEMDSLMTVNTSSPSAVPVFSIPTWDGILCYIWTLPGQ